MIRRPPRSTLDRSSAASDVYKRQGLEGAVHSHTRKAIELEISKEEIRQTVLLALPTIGLPSTMAAMSWVDDILDKQ